jgi:phosphoribosyl 1,2-cyclic phosphodiesterase
LNSQERVVNAMSVKFHILASGSSGNACLLDAGGFGVLIDFGLSPRQLLPRMRRCRITWDHVHAVVLTHAHSDHWQPAALTQIAKLGVPIYCHREHLEFVDRETRAFQAVMAAGRFRWYEPGQRLDLHANCQCLPFELPHDGARTCGFRFDGDAWAVGYAADLGSWTPALAKLLADVDLLALEFNHDVALQLESGRSPMLIRRVLGDRGHLSNEQAAALLCAILKRSEPGRLRHLIQLHLSRDCNRPDLALSAAQQALAALGIELAILTAHQDHKGTTIDLHGSSIDRQRLDMAAFMQPVLAFPE